MPQHDFDVANAAGAAFRADLNLALAAMVSNSSGTTEPTTMFAYQLWADTTAGLLKIRNAANSAWVTIGTLATANLGHVSVAGGSSIAGQITWTNTDYIAIPVGTTAQRPGSPANGMIRYNTDLTSFEGYRSAGGGAWSSIGGGGYTATTFQSMSASGTITSSTTDPRQLRTVIGNGGPQTISVTPFGTGANWKDGTEIFLVGTDDTNTVTLTYNNAANGLVGNFATIVLTKNVGLKCTYSAELSRWIASAPTWASLANPYATQAAKTTTYAIQASDSVLTYDSSGGTFTTTLPTAVSVTGKLYVLKKTDTSLIATTIATTSSQTIDGVTTAKLSTKNESLSIISDGSNWQIIARRIPAIWTAYTPTFTGFGTATAVNFIYRRIGESLEVWGWFAAGTVTGVTAQISLPSGLTTASTITGGQEAGRAYRNNASAANNFVLLANPSVSTVNFGLLAIASNTPATSQNASSIIATSDTVAVKFSVPITGWGG